MRRQDVLGDGAISADVDDRVRVTLAVRFEGGRHRVTTPRVQEGLQRDDAFVRDPGLAIEIDDAGQVGTLMPEFGAVTDLLEQVGDQGCRIDALARGGDAELRFGETPGQYPRVVAIPLDRAGVARNAVLLEPSRPLADRAREEDPRHGGAFPEGRL